jgi:hypothetical protein
VTTDRTMLGRAAADSLAHPRNQLATGSSQVAGSSFPLRNNRDRNVIDCLVRPAVDGWWTGRGPLRARAELFDFGAAHERRIVAPCVARAQTITVLGRPIFDGEAIGTGKLLHPRRAQVQMPVAHQRRLPARLMFRV